MLPYQQRVVEESSELTFKLIRLRDFIIGPMFNQLSDKEKDLLTAQHKFMIDYSDVLEERIKLFKQLEG